MLDVTAPCVLVSTARRPDRRLTARQWRQRVTAEVRRVTLGVVRYARRARPSIILIEQSDGLRTHHKAAHRVMNMILRTLPYTWHHGTVSAAAQLGASHARARLGWVGILK